MKRIMLKSKIHRAVITHADLDYIGSITIDETLMIKSDIREFEKVLVVDINNGARFETYVIKGEKDSGTICVNGAAARLVHKKDKIIILSFGEYDNSELVDYEPTIVLVNDENKEISVK